MPWNPLRLDDGRRVVAWIKRGDGKFDVRLHDGTQLRLSGTKWQALHDANRARFGYRVREHIAVVAFLIAIALFLVVGLILGWGTNQAG